MSTAGQPASRYRNPTGSRVIRDAWERSRRDVAYYGGLEHVAGDIVDGSVVDVAYTISVPSFPPLALSGFQVGGEVTVQIGVSA
jgi:hypothetical protein